jgi:carbonyl reductase 1
LLIFYYLNYLSRAVSDGTHREEGWPNSAYVVSKIALSALTIIQQRELDRSRPGEDILINSVTPGWVRSDMTGWKGFFSTEEGAAAPTWAALLPPASSDNPKGAYIWHDKSLVDWVNGPLPS